MKINANIKKEKIALWVEHIQWFATIGKGHGQICRLKNLLFSIYEEGIEEGKRQMKEEIINLLEERNIK